MKCDKKAMLLYAVTDRTWVGKQTLMEQVTDCLKGGATCVQLREKNLDEASFLQEAIEMRALCKQYNVPFIVNDNVEIAIVSKADGIHVGQSDMEASCVRDKIGPDMILGVSAKTVEQALRAEKSGADYLGVGAVFATSTKLDAGTVSYDTVKAICEAVSIPVVAIGGIGRSNLMQLAGSGVDGVAVVSAIFGAEDVRKATEELHVLSAEMIRR
ncbi:MAG: thiamine phosphate synthase [Oscillospiraceae bacterium]|jgi:thiamine-phosphate pyrophosphorylase